MALACLLGVAGNWGADGMAQDRRQITLRNGLSFEGEVGSFNTYNLEIAAADPFGTNKIVMVDDGLRRVFFCLDYVANTAPSNVRRLSMEVFQKTFSGAGSDGYASQVLSIGPFDDKGHRWLAVIDETGRRQTFIQGITEITPIYTELNTLIREESGNKRWSMRLATNSISPDILIDVMRRQITDEDDPSGFWQIFDIFTEARMFTQSLQELKVIEDRFPDLQNDIDRGRARIKSLAGDQILSEIALRREVGQPELAMGIAKVFVTEGMGDEKLIEFQDIQRALEAEKQNVIELRQKINEVVLRFMDTIPEVAQQQRLRRFLNDLEVNLNTDSAKRFEGLLRLLTLPDISDEQYVAQIVSRWYLGSGKAIDNFAIAESLIPVYELVREYLSDASPARREQILAEIAGYEGGAPEYLVPLLAQMPPPTPPDLANYTGETPLKLPISMPDYAGPDTPDLDTHCWVQLPPEYHPYRKYPVVILLPGIGSAEQYLDLWTGGFNPNLQIRQGLAGRNGYIAVSVDWKLPGQSLYGYSARETMLVLKTVRECLRRFSIDSDRVFLAGVGPGAEAAFDIAVAHPDIFAGVGGISGKMARYTEVYSKNKHLGLPVYAVVGEKDIDSRRWSAKTWNNWLTNDNYNELVLVEYRGRLAESFYEEYPSIFRWFSNQSRRHPNLLEDTEIDCEVFRPWDNRYYFYELLGLPPDSVIWPEFWRSSGYDKVLKMQVQKKGNRFLNLRPANQGAGAVLYLSPEYVDFSQKIEITGRGSFKDFVSPSVKVILEDVRTRGDRQHPVWAVLKHDNRSWQVYE